MAISWIWNECERRQRFNDRTSYFLLCHQNTHQSKWYLDIKAIIKKNILLCVTTKKVSKLLHVGPVPASPPSPWLRSMSPRSGSRSPWSRSGSRSPWSRSSGSRWPWSRSLGFRWPWWRWLLDASLQLKVFVVNIIHLVIEIVICWV